MKKFVLQITVLVIVLAIWFSHTLFRGHTTEIAFPLIFSNLQENVLVTEQTATTVQVTVEGKGIDITRFKNSQYSVNVDAKDFQVGKNDVVVSEQNIFIQEQSYRGSLRFYLNQHLEFQLDVTERISLPVTLRFLTIDDETFFRQRGAQAYPEEVEIVGASSIVSKLREITTVPLSASLVSNALKLEDIELEIPEGIASIKPDVVEVTMESPLLITRTISLINIEYPTDVIESVFPRTVTVKAEGYSANIQGLRPSSIRAYVVLPDNQEIELTTLSFQKPEGIRIVEYTPLRVQLVWK